MPKHLKSTGPALGLLLLVGINALAQRVLALDPKSSDARAILSAVLDAPNISRSLSRMKMSIRDRSGTRERIMSMRAKRYDNARKSLIVIEQPSDVRNTSFLTVDYFARERADEQWIFLPKLHRVSRVPSSGKAGSFVGSDFSISDLSPQSADSFEVKLLEPAVKVGDEECWLLETRPRNEAVRDETGYEKTQTWISKKKQVTVQIKMWLPGGSRTKYFKASDIRQVNGVWTAHRNQMRTLDGTNLVSETLLEMLNVDNDAKDVSDNDFTQQRLEQGI